MACTKAVPLDSRGVGPGPHVLLHTEPARPARPTDVPPPSAPPPVMASTGTPEKKVAISGALRAPGIHDPMPGGFLGGWGGDTGLDIAGDHLPVYALAAGTLDYAEWGHTRWTRKPDTAFSVRIRFDTPIPWNGHQITHAYYTHLSAVEVEVKEGADAGARQHVVAGERIGVSGIGNGTPHLHLGLLLDNQVEQDSWEFILREGEVRKVMGGYANGTRLPLSNRPK